MYNNPGIALQKYFENANEHNYLNYAPQQEGKNHERQWIYSISFLFLNGILGNLLKNQHFGDRETWSTDNR